jgi:SAM-dependent methyltransferase
LRSERIPTNSCILMPSRDEALRHPRGDLLLSHCPECGFVGNRAFDPALTVYSQHYEETQGFSATFQHFMQSSAQDLIARHDLHGKSILEIGCGKGEFLSLLCELGDNRGIGFDPAFVPGRRPTSSQARIEFVRAFYDEHQSHPPVDCIICRMTLEHIPNPLDFVAMVRRAVGRTRNTLLYVLVPNASRIFARDCFEDIYYEHCCYFTPGALARLFDRCGFEVLQLETTYDDQYIAIECRPGANRIGLPPLADDLEQTTAQLEGFAARHRRQRQRWQERLQGYAAHGQRAVLWGSGSKAVAFLANLGPAGNSIDHVVDINPYRHDYFMPGTGQRIVAPERLCEFRPDIVIAMNRIYSAEIAAQLGRLGLTPQLLTLD